MERYRKTVVAVIGVIAVIGTVLETADLSTTEGIIAAVVGALTATGVYAVPNEGA